ncbi:CDP-glycerol glycerophosphotransferase family protein [Nocardioides aurantiacus]|uniref:CDP-glycerol glycerophosphotransferase family protein n=1 Tax=Nocardioides aurantiacus TaxID=86796 RepID=UPI00403F90D3
MSPTSRRRAQLEAAATRLRRAPRKARRVGVRTARRLRVRVRGRSGPLLSVVVPVYNVREWVGAALDSVLAQSLTDLEVVVVDDGSQDGSMAVVRERAARDPRVRVVTQANAGLGAARNAGTRHATGEFLAFLDSDDLVLPGAYESLVGSLLSSGSDFVTGAFARGDEQEQVKPHWVTRTMREDRTGITIADEPDLLLDITAWNKVFRRSFWDRHELSFVEGVRYEDQIPITRAYLSAASFDVRRQQVYLWRTRLDGSSITQQKSSILDLTDRLATQQGCAELLRSAPPVVRTRWYVKLLEYDLPNYLLASLTADPAYVTMLQARLAALRDEVPPDLWHQVSFRNRAQSWALSHGRLDLGQELRAWYERETGGLPTRDVDGVRHYAPPFAHTEEELPGWLLRVHEVDVRPVVRLTATAWEGTTMVLRGSAFLVPLPGDPAEHELRVVVRHAGQDLLDVPVTHRTDRAVDDLSLLGHADMSASGYEARLDADRLARVAPPGQVGLELVFVQRQRGHERQTGITTVQFQGSAGTRPARRAGGRLVRLAGVVDTGLRLLVHDTGAWTSGHRVEDDRLLLELTSTADPVTHVLVDDRELAPAGPASADGTFTVVVDPAARGTLRTRHASGRTVPALWGDEPAAVGLPGHGATLRRAAGQGVVLDAPRPAVAVASLDTDGDHLVVRGTVLGAAGRRLALHGQRATGTPSEPLPEGGFELVVPLTQDPWGHGAAPLPQDEYDLVLVGPGPGLVVGGASLRAGLPRRLHAAGQHLLLGMDQHGDLRITSEALSVDEWPERQQQRLRREVYAAARSGPRQRSVLLESFAGSSGGDSPAAIAGELARSGLDLDLAWSVVDRSVRPPEGTRAVVRFSTEWYELLGGAAYLVNNAHFPHFFEKAEGQVYLQTWHGTPLKKIADDVADKRYFSTTYLRVMAYEAQAWSQLVSPSPFCSEVLPRAFGYAGPVLESGYPRNDALVGPSAAATRSDVRRALGIADDQRVLLYAPTWRESARTTRSHSKVLYLDPVEVTEALPDTVVLVRGHANTSRTGAVAGHGTPRVLDVTLYPDINDLYLASDALVTDYSSVMFDYSVLDRPVLLLVPDLADYRDKLRGFYLDLDEVAPGPLLADQDALLAHLRAGPAADAAYATARAAFRARFAPWDDGHAATRVVQAVFE